MAMCSFKWNPRASNLPHCQLQAEFQMLTMLTDASPKSEQSGSSNNSPPLVYMLRSEKDLNSDALFGPTAIKHNRSATVRRASSVSFRSKQDSFAKSQDDINIPIAMPTERYRRSLDSTYRQSLESISEYKAKKTFSYSSLGPPTNHRESVDSTCSDCTDYATRSAPVSKDENRTFISNSSASYFSWIESLHSEYNANRNSSQTNNSSDIVNVDNKVGEWNNFWLNYNNPNNRYLSSPYLYSTNEDRTGDDLSDCKSTCSTQREFNDKISNENIVLSLEEVQEALQCSQRIAEILNRALKRSEIEPDIFIDRSRQDSYYSQQTNSFNEESLRERSYSYGVEQQELHRQRSLLKPPPSVQPSSTHSCINAILGTGVADILKKVMAKRRDSAPQAQEDNTNHAHNRSSFSEWSMSAK